MSATARTQTLEDIYTAALDAVEEALGVAGASILLFDPDGVIRFKAWRGLSEGYRRATEGHTPWSADSVEAEPVVVRDVRLDHDLGIQALAFFPLLVPGRLLGKLVAYHGNPHEFTPTEITLGRLIAGHVAFAVERRHEETIRHDREAELVDFFDHAPLGLHWLGPDGTILRVNQAQVDLLGYEHDEYVGRQIADFLVDRAAIDDLRGRLGRGETLHEHEARMRHKNGTIRHVLMDSSARWESGRVVHFRCFTRDITDRNRAVEAQERLAAIVDSSDDAVISKDLRGIIRTWNWGAERLFGYTAAEAVGQSITILIPPESIQEEVDILDRIRRGRRVEHYETVRVRKSGDRVDISLTVSPVRDGTGRIVGASKIARDITEWKRSREAYQELLAREQQARAEAESANRAKDDFLATLSHELRTPLNAVLGWAQVLGRTPNDSGTVKRALDTITRNAKQQARIIEDLLDLSGIRSGRVRLDLRPVDLVGVISAALESIRPAVDDRELELLTECDPSVGPVLGDPERLQQILWNLLTNAVKFSPRRGRVRVRLEEKESRAVVSIEDGGIGIRPDVLPLIFERFRQADSSVTRAHGGLGLGLAIVHELVAMHGGTVEAMSPGEGQGATFQISLPVMPSRDGPRFEQTVSTPASVRCDGIHALLVDDEVDGRDMLAMFLQRSGGEVTAVDSVASALKAIERRRPDVVVSDIAMPGVDGYELIRRIRAMLGGGDIRAIALTAHASADARIEALRAGYDIYLTKPADPAELSAVISQLGRRAQS
jgi:PAS domain S-box-containing protein